MEFKKGILLITCFIILVSLIYAFPYSQDTSYYIHFDSQGTDNYNTIGNDIPTNGSGISYHGWAPGEGCDSIDDDENCAYTDDQQLTDIFDFSIIVNSHDGTARIFEKTFNSTADGVDFKVWVNITDDNTFNWKIEPSTSAKSIIGFGANDDESVTNWVYLNDAGAYADTGVAIKDGWTNFSMKYNSSGINNVTYWINDVRVFGYTDVAGFVKFKVTNYGDEANGHDNLMYLADIVVYNGTNRTAGEVTGDLTWEDPTPPSGRTNNTYENVVINASCSAGNVTLWWGNTSNTSIMTVNNTPSPVNFTLNSDIIGTGGTYYYKGSCNYGVANTSIRSWIYDTVAPSIIINPTNFFNANNYSSTSQYIDNIILNISVSDNNDLFALNITIIKDDVVYFNYANLALSGNTIYNYSTTINTSTWPKGIYDTEIVVSDAHTKITIPKYKIKKSNRVLEFDTDEGNYIKITSDSDATTNAIKENDKYSFEFNFKTKGISTKTFDIISDNKIHYLPNSDYPGHFVVWNDNKGNWIDFNGLGKLPTIKKITDKHYTIKFNNVGDNLIFNSIGGVNTITRNFTWYKGSTLRTENSNLSAVSTLFTLNITNTSSISTIAASLFYNSAHHTQPIVINYSNYIVFQQSLTAKTVAANENLSYYWEIITTQGDGNISRFNLTDIHYLKSWGLDNCTSSSIVALNFSIWNEEDLKNLTADVQGTFTYNGSAGGNTSGSEINYTIDIGGVHVFELCISPEDIEVSTDIYLQYESSGGKKERYYADNLVISSTTQQVKIYNFNSTTLLSKLIAITVDDIYSDYPNVLMKMQRWYPAQNAWLQVQTDKSDEFGQGVFYVHQNDVDYRFIFEKDNVFLKKTDPLKFLCGATGVDCEQTFIIQDIAAGDVFIGMTGTLVYDNTSGLFTFAWNDPNNVANSVRLLVEKHTVSSVISICDNRQTSASGSMVCNISDYEGTITARAYRSSSPDSAWMIETIEKIVDALQQIVDSNIGMFLSALLLITAIGIGMAAGPGATVGIGTIGVIFLFMLKLNSVINLTFTITILALGVFVLFMVKR